jgi:hypothetical protein
MADTVTFTMTQVLTGAAAVAVLGGGLVAWTVGGMRDEMSALRKTVGDLQVSDKQTAVGVRDTENKLINELSHLRVAIAALSGKMDNISGSMTALSNRLDDFHRQLVARQTAASDPQAATTLVRALKDAGIGDKDVVFLSIDPLSFAPAMQKIPAMQQTPAPR